MEFNSDRVKKILRRTGTCLRARLKGRQLEREPAGEQGCRNPRAPKSHENEGSATRPADPGAQRVRGKQSRTGSPRRWKGRVPGGDARSLFPGCWALGPERWRWAVGQGMAGQGREWASALSQGLAWAREAVK